MLANGDWGSWGIGVIGDWGYINGPKSPIPNPPNGGPIPITFLVKFSYYNFN